MICSLSLLAQRAMNEEDISAHSVFFTLGDGFQGNGAELLTKEISEAQFIVFGELHNSHQMSLFFNQLLRESSKHGFDKLALEVGPNSGSIIQRLMDEDEPVAEGLKTLLRKYDSKGYRWPIPFVKGVEDAQFLQSASDLGHDLWGIDQEYTLGAEILFDELLATAKQEANYSAMAKAKEVAVKARKKLNRKGRGCGSLSSPEIASYFAMFDSAPASKIIEALKKSWTIYCHYEKGEYKENNRSRIDYMRANMARQIEEIKAEDGKLAKVLVKMGSFHTGRIKSPVGLQDVGHLMGQLAKENNTKSLHIRYLRRFWKGKDKLDAKDYANSRIFLTIGKRDEWAVIDLRPLREKIRAGELTATDWEKFEIFNHDLMLMAPEDKWVKNNF